MSRYLGFKAVESGEYYFVSYNSQDEKRVSEYALAMNKAGVPMWYDDGIEVGKKWEKQIADKIEGCVAVIIFLSKNIFKYVGNFYNNSMHGKGKMIYPDGHVEEGVWENGEFLG